MSLKLVGITETRESILEQISDCVKYVSENCFYCRKCWKCSVTSRLQKEANKKCIKTFNSHIRWWTLEWIDNFPILRTYE